MKCFYTFVDNELQSYVDNQQICEPVGQKKKKINVFKILWAVSSP